MDLFKRYPYLEYVLLVILVLAVGFILTLAYPGGLP